MARQARKTLYKRFEGRIRRLASLPHCVPGYGFLLSFPRSGNHWVRYIIESISGYSTLGAREGTGPGNTTLWIDTPIRLKLAIPGVRRAAIVIKRHHMRQQDSRTAPLVFLVRHPAHAILSHHSLKPLGPETLAAATTRFVDLCTTVDEWAAPTKVIYYEDVMAEETRTVAATIDQLMTGLAIQRFEKPLTTFIQHLDRHREQSLLSLERAPQSHKINWDSAEVVETIGTIDAALLVASERSLTLREICARYGI